MRPIHLLEQLSGICPALPEATREAVDGRFTDDPVSLLRFRPEPDVTRESPDNQVGRFGVESPSITHDIVE